MFGPLPPGYLCIAVTIMMPYFHVGWGESYVSFHSHSVEREREASYLTFSEVEGKIFFTHSYIHVGGLDNLPLPLGNWEKLTSTITTT